MRSHSTTTSSRRPTRIRTALDCAPASLQPCPVSTVYTHVEVGDVVCHTVVGCGRPVGAQRSGHNCATPCSDADHTRGHGFLHAANTGCVAITPGFHFRHPGQRLIWRACAWRPHSSRHSSGSMGGQGLPGVWDATAVKHACCC